MSLYKNLQLLARLADGQLHSGADLAQQLSITRTAVWKRLQALRRRGVALQAVKGRGYRLRQPVELLDRSRLLALLDDDVRPLAGMLTLHAEIDSTNQYLQERVHEPDFHGHLVLAEYQNAGRGRRGRRWHAPLAAGICLSLGWCFDPAPQPLTLISLAAGVAVMRALRRIGISDAGLKWPNDICWQGRKLGGILVEAREESAGPCRAILGLGLNYRFPDAAGRDLDQPWVDIATIQPLARSRHECTAAVISEVVRQFLAMTAKHEAHAAIINEWRRHDCMQGKRARLLLPDGTVSGRVTGIDQNGALLMDIRGRLARFHTGELSLRALP